MLLSQDTIDSNNNNQTMNEILENDGISNNVRFFFENVLFQQGRCVSWESVLYINIMLYIANDTCVSKYHALYMYFKKRQHYTHTHMCFFVPFLRHIYMQKLCSNKTLCVLYFHVVKHTKKKILHTIGYFNVRE